MTFDPFMYLSLPLPSTAMRTMTVTVLGTNGSIMPSSFTVAVPKCGRCKDLIQAISVACSLRDDENILVAEVCCRLNVTVLHWMPLAGFDCVMKMGRLDLHLVWCGWW